MDFEILPQLIIVFSLVGMLYILGRNLSRIKEMGGEIFTEESEKRQEEEKKFSYLYKRAVRRFSKEDYQKKLAEFLLWLEKFLRKVRIMFLKLDGKIVQVLEELRKKNVESIEKLRETERNILKNMEGESANLSKLWNMKKAGFRPKAEEANFKKQDEVEKIEDVPGRTVILEESVNAVKETAGEDAVILQEKVVEYVTAEEDHKFSKEDSAGDDAVTEAKDSMPAQEEMEGGLDDEENAEDNQKIRTKKEQECIEALMENPADVKAYWKLGIIYSKRRNYEDALACFKQIVKIDPTYTKAKQKALELMEKMKGKGK